MNRLIKIFLLFTISLNLISCNKMFEQKYPETVIFEDGFWAVESKYEVDINSFEEYPKRIQNLAKKYLIGKIGENKFEESKFSYGYIASNKSINEKYRKNEMTELLYGKESIENAELDSKYNYPVYSIGFEMYDLKKGIEKYDLNFIMDNNGKILKRVNFPKIDLRSDIVNFIPIDSIHQILSRKKISRKKLELELRYNKKEESVFYYARTLIKNGSIAGPSCFPQKKEHFRVNAITGEIIEYNIESSNEYYSN
jgi:hypothetical protein